MQDEHTSTSLRVTPAAIASDATPQPPSAPTSFWHLPYELRHAIVLTACSSPVLPRHTTVGRSTDCTTTMLALLRTARVLYPVIIPLLYSHVRITRPSTLMSFQQTLASRPSLGRLVKALHIGADEPLPYDWFPICQEHRGKSGPRLFTFDLGGSHETTGSWIGSEEYEYDMRDARYSGAEGRALDLALDSAADDLDVSLVPEGDGHDYNEKWVGMSVWVVRVLEVRAAMELYYLELQRLDDEERHFEVPSHQHAPAPYPCLKVISSSIPSTDARGNFFYVTRSQIFERLASSGAPTDSFSHPLLFARSVLSWIAQASDEDPYENTCDEIGRPEQIADVFSEAQRSRKKRTADEQRARDALLSLNQCDPLNLARPSTATVGGCLALGGLILYLTPQVRSLSLTGFFERLVAGKRPPCHQALKSLTLGPAPAGWWGDTLQLNHSTLRGLKRLRLCGNLLADEEIGCIVRGENGALPNLKTFQWSMVEDCSEYSEAELIQAVNGLLGVDLSKLGETNTHATANTSRKRSRTTFEDTAGESHHQESEDEGEARKVSTRPRQVHIEAHLHPEDIELICWTASEAKEVCEALHSGSELPGVRHRFRLVENPAYIWGRGAPTWSSEEGMKGLYDQGRTWWEEG